jgi:uncharacterized protein (TIGR02145 family)
MKNSYIILLVFFQFNLSAQNFNCGDSIIDIRDGKTYATVLIGTQCWMKSNLNIGIRVPITSGQGNNSIIEKECYFNDDAYCNVYGGLYQYGEAMNWGSNPKGICPDGWHIPSVIELQTLMSSVGGDSVAGIALKESGLVHWQSPNNGTNSSGFTGLPGGWSNYISAYSLGTGADFITTNSNKFFQLANNDTYARLNQPGQSGLSFSIRCICDSIFLSNISDPKTDFNFDNMFSELYPNPLTENSIIKIKSYINKDYYFEIYNSLGQLLKRIIVNNTDIEISKSNFPSGLYIYRIIDNYVQIKTGRFEIN